MKNEIIMRFALMLNEELYEENYISYSMYEDTRKKIMACLKEEW